MPLDAPPTLLAERKFPAPGRNLLGNPFADKGKKKKKKKKKGKKGKKKD